MSQFYTKGTIKIKNVDGVLEPFLPKTDINCITDDNNVSLTQKITNLETQITEAENSGGIELMYEEPDSTNTADFSNETMIGWIQPDTWRYTVDTRLYDNTGTNAKTGIPFRIMAGSGNVLNVNWGDNTESTITYSSNVSVLEIKEGSPNKNWIHTYSIPGIYTVTISSYNFNYAYMYTISSSSYGSEHYSTTSPMDYFKKTLIRINEKLPTLYNNRADGNGYFDATFRNCNNLILIPIGLFDNNTLITDFNYCFYGCTNLVSIPQDLFKYNYYNATFDYCFAECTSLTEIPTGLFENNSSVTVIKSKFVSCFSNCTSLISIPQDLFKYNTSATSFSSCFRGCSSLTSIPSGLFDNCTDVTSFSYCFEGCSSLNDFTIHIGSSNVSNVTSFVTNKAGTTRTVYVPTGSTTQTTFNNKASSLGLTVIGE